MLARPQGIAFIGLGRMGFEMANNLFAKTFIAQPTGSSFVVCDALPETAQKFRQQFLKTYPTANVDIASTPAEAVRMAQTVVTMLPSSPHVNSVYKQDGGLIPALMEMNEDKARATLCIDSTTLDVKVARSIASQLTEMGAHIVDAPVSGGVSGAQAGTLSFLVGGTEQDFAMATPLLERMGTRIVHCGSSGSGLGAKICNNLILGVHQIVTAEAMLLGKRLGLDPKVLASVVQSSTGGSWSTGKNNPVPGALEGISPPCERDYDGGFAMSLMLKDMGLASQLASETSTPLPLGGAAEKMYQKVISEEPGLAKKDFSSVYSYLKNKAGEM